MDGKEIASYIFAISIGIYVFAYVAIPALIELFAANVTGLPTAVSTLVTTVVGICVAIAVVVKFMPAAIRDKVGM